MNGTQIGPYVVLGELARGGMASVHAARHLRLGHLVAIKMLHPQYQKNQEVAVRFLEEARIQANLRHPNILTVQDIIELSDWSGIVMELLDGVTLSSYYRQVSLPLDVPRIMGIFLPLIDALVYAHDSEVVHRDLKPANVFLHCGKQELIPKLMDFGIAKVRNTAMQTNLTAAGAVLGTPQYMAPEQFEDSSKVDYRADIYAMGVMLYEAISGRLPFFGMTPGAVMKEVLLSPLTPLKDVVAGVDPELEALVLRCLDRNRENRFESAHSLFLALEALSTRLGRKVPGVGEIERVDLKSRGIDLPSSRGGHGEIGKSTIDSRLVDSMGAPPSTPMVAIGDGEPVHLPLTQEKGKSGGEPQPNATDWNATATTAPKAKSRKWLWAILGLLMLAGGGAAALVLLETPEEKGKETPAATEKKPEVAPKPADETPDVSAIQQADPAHAADVKAQEVAAAPKTDISQQPDVESSADHAVHEPDLLAPKKPILEPLPTVDELALGRGCLVADGTPRGEAERAIHAHLQAGWRGRPLSMMSKAELTELGLMEGDTKRAKAMAESTGDPLGDEMASWLSEATKPFLAGRLNAENLADLQQRLQNPQLAAFTRAKVKILCNMANAVALNDEDQAKLFTKVLEEEKLSFADFGKLNTGKELDPLLKAEVYTRAICCLIDSGKIR